MRCGWRVADVRDATALRSALKEGVKEFGRLDFVVANAGISTAQFKMTTLEEARYITGSNIPVDAGFVNRVD